MYLGDGLERSCDIQRCLESYSGEAGASRCGVLRIPTPLQRVVCRLIVFKIIEAGCAETTRFSRLTFGQAIRQERERMGLSQEDFAERANVHRTYISSIELGKVSVGIEIAHALACALGVRLSELVRKAE